MDYERVQPQLLELIKNPTVLVDKDNVPPEFRDGGSLNRLKRRRFGCQIPLELYQFAMQHELTKEHMMEFTSGLILNYASTSSIYV